MAIVDFDCLPGCLADSQAAQIVAV